MNADATYQIGKDHKVCEDYSLAEIKSDFAYAIVCDGCSASQDVDFGARILAMAAKNVLLRCDPTQVHKDLNNFGKACILKANQIFECIPHLHPQALDATLLVTWVYDSKLTALMYGDGIFILKKKSGIQAFQSHITSGAPDYLSYLLDERRMADYNGLENNTKELWTDEGAVQYPLLQPIILQFGVEVGDVACVISDGINSFRKPDNETIHWRELIPEFTDFKTTSGEFVHRRIAAMKRKHAKELVTHSDDISLAAIVI
jgi:serine/threonine protein phosphatase PrpC